MSVTSTCLPQDQPSWMGKLTSNLKKLRSSRDATDGADAVSVATTTHTFKSVTSSITSRASTFSSKISNSFRRSNTVAPGSARLSKDHLSILDTVTEAPACLGGWNARGAHGISRKGNDPRDVMDDDVHGDRSLHGRNTARATVYLTHKEQGGVGRTMFARTDTPTDTADTRKHFAKCNAANYSMALLALRNVPLLRATAPALLPDFERFAKGLAVGMTLLDSPGYVVTRKATLSAHAGVAHVCARHVFNQQAVKVKFFQDEQQWRRERATLMACRGDYVQRLVDAAAAHGYIPAALVVERGRCSLRQYLSMRRLGLSQRVSLLREVCECIANVHAASHVHGSLSMRHVVLFPGDAAWKLVGVGRGGPAGAPAPDCREVLDPRECAPEHALAVLQGKAPTLTQAADMWQLGLMAYELLTGVSYFSSAAGEMELWRALLALDPLPHELGNVWAALDMLPWAPARALLSALMHRNPQERPQAWHLLRCGVFEHPCEP